MSEPALTYRFDVTIDGVAIGVFTACEGLTAEYDVYPYEEGGQNGYVHQIPGRLKFQPIKLSRPLDPESGVLAAWFSSLRATVKRGTACITAYDGNGKVVAKWNLIGVFPYKWTGPSLDSGGSEAAKESLELWHNGFFDLPVPGGAMTAGASAGAGL